MLAKAITMVNTLKNKAPKMIQAVWSMGSSLNT
jgi:hypothetical protein